MSAVISCVTENCNCSAWSIGCIFTGNMFGKIRREIKNPMNKAFNMAPIPIETGSPAVFPNLFRSNATITTRMTFPIMIHGNRAGTAAITGIPVMKKEVIGVIILRMIPQASPA